jgi:mRNA-degrading endonuclease RelE of RelBE toxin-antitoxin system
MVTMPKRKRFALLYPPIIKQHLKFIEAKYYSLIRDSIEAQLEFEPDVETRNRKPLKRPVVFGAKWEIRFGVDNRFRVFYRVDYDEHQVVILAIGEKLGNRLLIGGEEVEI